MWYADTLEGKQKKVSHLSEEIKKLEALISEEEAQLKAKLQGKEQDYKHQLEERGDTINHLGMDLTKLKEIEKEKKAIMQDIATLKIQVEQEKKEGMIEINERERDKIYAVKKLSEEMDYKVKETQANLMALNDEQLHTTTRLTILQNH